MSALNIEIIGSAALHPQGRGQIERAVGTVKLLMRKILLTRPDLDWELIPLIITKCYNNSTSPKTNFKPFEMVFGKDIESDSAFSNITAKPHIFVRNYKTDIEQITTDISNMAQIATENLTLLRNKTAEKLNTTRNTKVFKKGQYVFVLDNKQVPGINRTLTTKFNPSPYVVEKSFFTTTLVRRIADNLTSVYYNDQIKAYDPKSKLFEFLPLEVKNVLSHNFDDLIAEDFNIITNQDTLSLPTGIQLFQRKVDRPIQDSQGPDRANPASTSDSIPSNSGWQFDDDIDDIDFAATKLAQLEELDNLDLNSETSENSNNLGNYDSDSNSESDEEEGMRLRTGKIVRFK